MTTKDLSTATTTNEKLFIFVKKDGLGLDVLAVANCESGASPTPTTYSVKYDTTTNLCKLYTTNLTTQDRNVSFPIAIAQGSSSGFTSIDQVFNGFGYIGSTVFALPGIKGLIPEGRNEDGSSRNREFTFSKVGISTFIYNKSTVIFTDWQCTLSERTTYYIVDTYSDMLAINKDGLYYVKNDNKCYSWAGGSGVVYANYIPIAFFDLDSTCKITSFNSKTTFCAVDHNDSSWIAEQAMPSSKYMDLTLGSSGSSYTAPANGYFNANGITSSANGRIELYYEDVIFGIKCVNSLTSNTCRCFIPAKKGEKVFLAYDGITPTLKFYYAEGEN